MTNREVLAKFIKQAFDIEITNRFVIKCGDVYCRNHLKCDECHVSNNNYDFWDEEFVGDVNAQINEINDNIQINNNNERVAIREISW